MIAIVWLAGFATGQAVVAEWQDGAYYTGTVKAADAKHVEVAWTDGSEPTSVAPDEAFAIPKNARRKLEVGALALCAFGTGAKWHDCRIEKLTAHGATVAYLDGDAGDVGWDGVIIPTGRAAKELAARAKPAP
jgi:hypothetical protein